MALSGSSKRVTETTGRTPPCAHLVGLQRAGHQCRLKKKPPALGLAAAGQDLGGFCAAARSTKLATRSRWRSLIRGPISSPHRRRAVFQAGDRASQVGDQPVEIFGPA